MARTGVHLVIRAAKITVDTDAAQALIIHFAIVEGVMRKAVNAAIVNAVLEATHVMMVHAKSMSATNLTGGHTHTAIGKPWLMD